MSSYKRHFFKTITWRLIATSDTVLIAFFLTDNFTQGLKIGFVEIFTKMIIYFIHERLWFKSNFVNPNIRHILKTFSWRIVGTIDTVIIAWIILGNYLIGFQVGLIELFTKIFFYYIHEKIWYRVDYGVRK